MSTDTKTQANSSSSSSFSFSIYFPPVKPLHFVLSCAHSFFRPSLFKSCLTHSSHVFLLLPLLFMPTTSIFLQADVQSSLSFRSKCPNHFNLPRLTTSVTPSSHKRLFKSSLDVVFLRLTPHIRSLQTLHILYLHWPSFSTIHS